MFELNGRQPALVLLALTLLPMPLVAGDELFDPTRPSNLVLPVESSDLQAVAQEQAPPRLQAVFSRAGHYSAMLDGRRLVVGEELDGYRVVAIERGGVTLDRDGEPLQLHIGGSAIKRETREERR